jgi:hypothetical protein
MDVQAASNEPKKGRKCADFRLGPIVLDVAGAKE